MSDRGDRWRSVILTHLKLIPLFLKSNVCPLKARAQVSHSAGMVIHKIEKTVSYPVDQFEGG
jgi:hypothetical protein